MASFEDFVPDPATVAVPLASGATHDPYAAILVNARVVVRSTWTDESEVSPQVFAALSAEQVPEPNLDAVRSVKFRLLAQWSREARPRKCRACFATPGRQTCSICGGEGILADGDEARPCPGCIGGHVQCSTCDGSTKSIAVEVLFCEDAVRPAAHIFLPDVPAGLGTSLVKHALVRFFQSRESIPDALRIELSDDFARVDAYRGRRGDDEVRGHRTGRALAQARNYVDRLGKLPSVVAMRHSAYAWPFFLSSALDRVALCVADERGATQILG